MDIQDYSRGHIPASIELVQQNYLRQRTATPALPEINGYPEMETFAQNGLGVAATSGGKLLGFLCCWGPFNNAFHSTPVAGVFSPLHGNAAVEDDHALIYAKMYQAAAKKWVSAGAVSHGICLYTGDASAKEMLFQYGFGLRCVDAVCLPEPAGCAAPERLCHRELEPERFSLVYPLFQGLVRHLGQSPTFLCYPAISIEQFEAESIEQKARYFGAFDDERLVAYFKVSGEGENFATLAPSMANISGAYCLPQYRGCGVAGSLLAFVRARLYAEGYRALGVDYESFNPTARGFWGKYFTDYTHGLVRRVDEHILCD